MANARNAVQIEGLREFQSQLGKAGKSAIPSLRDGFKKGAEEVALAAPGEAPRGPTGELAGSFVAGATASLKEVRAFVKSKAKHARVIDYGPTFTRAQAGFIRVPHSVSYTPNPFIERALAKRSDAVMRSVTAALDGVLGKLADGGI